MNMLHMLVFAAIAAVLVSLFAGVLAMCKDGEVGANDSASWMNWRVGFQALAAALVLAAAYAEA